MKRVSQESVPSESIRVIFDTDALPNRIKIGHVSFQVRPCVFPTLQCYNCQMVGHTALGCTRMRRCLICSGNHHHKDCTNSVKFCANCKKSHTANSSDCDIIKRAKQYERAKTINSKEMQQPGGGTSNLIAGETIAEVHHRQNSQVNSTRSLSRQRNYRSALLKDMEHPMQQNKTLSTKSTQTEENYCNEKIGFEVDVFLIS